MDMFILYKFFWITTILLTSVVLYEQKKDKIKKELENIEIKKELENVEIKEKLKNIELEKELKSNKIENLNLNKTPESDLIIFPNYRSQLISDLNSVLNDETEIELNMLDELRETLRQILSNGIYYIQDFINKTYIKRVRRLLYEARKKFKNIESQEIEAISESEVILNNIERLLNHTPTSYGPSLVIGGSLIISALIMGYFLYGSSNSMIIAMSNLAEKSITKMTDEFKRTMEPFLNSYYWVQKIPARLLKLLWKQMEYLIKFFK